MKSRIKEQIQRDARKRVCTYLALAVILVMFFIGLALLMTNDIQDPSAGETFDKLDMYGEYCVDNGEWTAFNSFVELPLDIHFLKIRGHFNKELDAQENIVAPIYGLRYKMRINSQEVVNFGEEGSYRFSHGPGYTIWYKGLNSILGRGLTKEDEVEIEVENVYYKTKKELPYIIMNSLSYGREIVFFRYVRDNAVEEIWGVVIISTAFLVCGFSIVMFHANSKQLQAGLSFSFFALVAGLYSLIKTVYGFLPLLIKNPVLCAYLDVFALFFMLLSFTLYVLFNLIGRKTVRIMYFFTWINIIVSGLSFMCQLSGKRDLFEMQFFVMIPGFISIVAGIACLIWDAIHYKNSHSMLLVFILAPFVLALLLSQLNPRGAGNYVRYGIFASAVLHFLEMIRFYSIQKRVEAERVQIEKELIESRVAVMQSQIQPHFLYNSLSTIQILCEKDPKLASEAVEHFSRYLRINMDSLNQKKCISFEKELTHLENYLFIEKLRFRNLLEIKYDIQTKNFMCPSLSLQPIVENAVKHGLGKKEDGGYVKISSFEDDESFVVVVEDNGVGFDVNEVQSNEGRSHVGLENAKKRLWEMCNGLIDIKSEIGVGTRVTMRIPKE